MKCLEGLDTTTCCGCTLPKLYLLRFPLKWAREVACVVPNAHI